jgi:hypothetical protein
LEAIVAKLIVLYLSSLLPVMWGVTHLFATKGVVAGFGDISQDNRRIITMEWIVEGAALIFIGVLVALVTYVDPGSSVSQAVYWASFAMLNVLSVVSLMTGFKINFLPFKLCPVIFTGASVMIAVAILL